MIEDICILFFCEKFIDKIVLIDIIEVYMFLSIDFKIFLALFYLFLNNLFKNGSRKIIEIVSIDFFDIFRYNFKFLSIFFYFNNSKTLLVMIY